jgi:hypothetical protein
METVDRLKRDHGVLRSKLDLLEFGLGQGPQAWFMLREACFTLSKQIADHLRREEELIAACRKQLPPEVLAHVALEHEDEPEHLRTINRLFVTTEGHSLERIQPALKRLIHGMREHLADEEADLFPALERITAGREVTLPAPAAGDGPLSPSMTVNRVVREFPGAQRALERLFVNVPLEGCACLDEVAWRHGMTTQELIELLCRQIGLPRDGKAPADVLSKAPAST